MYYGYYISSGYYGRVGNRWMLFATEEEYVEYIQGITDEKEN